MIRLPLAAFHQKALELQRDYRVICLQENIEMEDVNISAKWVREWLAEDRLSSRRPNRKFKVRIGLVSLKNQAPSRTRTRA